VALGVIVNLARALITDPLAGAIRGQPRDAASFASGEDPCRHFFSGARAFSSRRALEARYGMRLAPRARGPSVL
jgi:hypothetical protein